MTSPWLAALSPLLCLLLVAQASAQDSAGPIIDRIEARVEQLRESLEGNSREMHAMGERFDRFDGIRDHEGRIIGSRIGTFLDRFSKFLDRLERMWDGAVIVAVVIAAAVVCVCAVYGVEKVSVFVQWFRSIFNQTA